MTAVRRREVDDPAGLTLEALAVPTVADDEVLVRVHAAAITRDELAWDAGRLPSTPSYEVSGTVVLTGPAADLAIGTEVYGLTPFDRDGAAAAFAAIPAAILAPKPVRLGHVEAAAIPMAGLTAWQGLKDHGGLEAGRRVLITGPHGGVGHIAVQLARAWGAEVVMDPVASGEVDLVFDTTGSEQLHAAIGTLRRGGRLVSVADELTDVPSDAGIETDFFIVEPARAQLVALAAMADRGELVPEIDAVFPLAEARAAFERLTARGKRGKVVLEVIPDGGAPA